MYSLLTVTMGFLLSVNNVGSTPGHIDEIDLFQIRVPESSGGANRNAFENAVYTSVIGYTHPLNEIYEQYDSIAQPPLLVRTPNANRINHLDLVFECRSDAGRIYYYEKSQVEQLVPGFPQEPYNFQQNNQRIDRPLYPHHFRNEERFEWPLNKTACDNAGESRLEMPMGRYPPFRWDWESYFTSFWPLPNMSKVGYNLPRPKPWLVRIIYVYEVAGDNLLCGVIIHRTNGEEGFKLCLMKEDPRNINLQ